MGKKGEGVVNKGREKIGTNERTLWKIRNDIGKIGKDDKVTREER